MTLLESIVRAFAHIGTKDGPCPIHCTPSRDEAASGLTHSLDCAWIAARSYSTSRWR